MRAEQQSPKTFFLGILGIAVGGCGADGTVPETGGATGGAQAMNAGAGGGAGGTSGSGGGGSGGAGVSGLGGRTGSSGSAGLNVTGGMSGVGGTTPVAGSGDTGGATSGAPGGGQGAASGGAPDAGQAGVMGGRGGSPPMGGAAGTAVGGGGSGGSGTGTCTASKATGTNASGSGPHQVTVETNADSGIKEGTIFRPTDLGGSELYPIFVWGEGGCSQDGLSNATAMAELASHGYFVIADGTPNGSGNRTMDRSQLKAMGAPLMAYVDWASAENEKPCSAYYQSLDTTKIASNGFSCGGLMSQGTVLDPRIVTWGVNSSGMAGANQDFYDLIHTPVLFVEGGADDIAYDGGLEGYDATSKLSVPVLWFSKALGHGGDLFSAGGGDFTKINLAWLNWWLKGDEGATGKGALVGAGCKYCSDSAWEVKSANVPP